MKALKLRRAPTFGVVAALCGTFAGIPRDACAKEVGIDAAPMQGKKLRLDGLLREWPQTAALTEVVSGTATKGDPAAFGVMGYDDEALYVAMRVEDASFIACC